MERSFYISECALLKRKWVLGVMELTEDEKDDILEI